MGNMVGDKKEIRIFWPVGLVFLILIGFVVYRLSKMEWEPQELAELGSRYRYGEIDGSEGYDGQFAYYIAVNPNPDQVIAQLDVAAYRYQRILYPLLARILSIGKVEWIPWTLILINIFAHVFGTAILCKYLHSLKVPVRYSLIYGIWAGLVIGVGTDLYEPLAYSFLMGAFYARFRGRYGISSLLMTCSLFTKETVIPFWVAVVIVDLLAKKRLKEVVLSIVPGILYGFWQICLYLQFGAFGFASGGAMATSFEWIPYGGFFRIGSAGIEVLVLYILIFGPTIILPNLWGTIISFQKVLQSLLGFENWALLLNSLFITFLPFSTYREPLGLVRVSTGLILSIILFAVKHNMRRPLNIGMFWMAFLVLMVG